MRPGYSAACACSTPRWTLKMVVWAARRASGKSARGNPPLNSSVADSGTTATRDSISRRERSRAVVFPPPGPPVTAIRTLSFTSALPDVRPQAPHLDDLTLLTRRFRHPHIGRRQRGTSHIGWRSLGKPPSPKTNSIPDVRSINKKTTATTSTSGPTCTCLTKVCFVGSKARWRRKLQMRAVIETRRRDGVRCGRGAAEDGEGPSTRSPPRVRPRRLS